MRYFTGPSQLFDGLRTQVMQMLGQPNGKAAEPWPAGITSLALSPHEYTPPEYQQFISYALSNGAQEITEAEYQALQPQDSEP